MLIHQSLFSVFVFLVLLGALLLCLDHCVFLTARDSSSSLSTSEDILFDLGIFTGPLLQFQFLFLVSEDFLLRFLLSLLLNGYTFRLYLFAEFLFSIGNIIGLLLIELLLLLIRRAVDRVEITLFFLREFPILILHSG